MKVKMSKKGPTKHNGALKIFSSIISKWIGPTRPLIQACLTTTDDCSSDKYNNNEWNKNNCFS